MFRIWSFYFWQESQLYFWPSIYIIIMNEFPKFWKQKIIKLRKSFNFKFWSISSISNFVSEKNVLRSDFEVKYLIVDKCQKKVIEKSKILFSRHMPSKLLAIFMMHSAVQWSSPIFEICFLIKSITVLNKFQFSMISLVKWMAW